MEKKYKTLILDDDRQISLLLENLVDKKIPELELVGLADSVSSGIELIQSTEPDLIFMDIGFPDGDGFSIIDKCKYTDYEVIFISSHEQFAMKAFEYSALHYLKKPIIPQEVFDAVERFLTNSTENNESPSNKVLAKGEQKLIIPSSEGLHIINIDDIIRCEASDVYTYFYLKSGKKLIASKSLNNYEKLFSDLNFVRVHSKHLVNLKYVSQYIKGKGGSLILDQGDEIEVSIRKKMDFMNKLKDYARSLK